MIPGAWNNWGARRKEFAALLERMDQRMDERMEESNLYIRESRAQLRARTDAIWKLLDRWGERPPPDPA